MREAGKVSTGNDAYHHRKNTPLIVGTPIYSPRVAVHGYVCPGKSLHTCETPFLQLQHWGSGLWSLLLPLSYFFLVTGIITILDV